MQVQRITQLVAKQSSPGSSRIRVIFGPEAGLEVQLPAVGVTFGAETDCDVVLTDGTVSGRHCTVIPKPAGFEVCDLGSRNGTLVDGIKVERALVPVGSTLQLGTTLVQLLPSEEVLALPPSERESFGDLFGQSLAMRQVYALLERATTSSGPVLLLGESGTGKELAARAIHEQGVRRDGPFVVFDCGAASETLIESELFGYTRGAFTGADRDRKGAFATADGGTLFLDEIGDLPLALQPKLLRMLEAKEVTPLGSRRSERHDVRIIAATHRDLWQDVGRGTFRGDLYYRLAVLEVHLPPLRRRKEDIATLTRLFLSREGFSVPEIRGGNLDRLQSYDWPGNVRELRNVIARAAALSRPSTPFESMPILLRAASRPAEIDEETASSEGRTFRDAKTEVVVRFERAYLRDLLQRADNNLALAARMAGLERKYLYRLLRRVDLLPDSGRTRTRSPS